MAAWRLGTPPEGACDAERPGRRAYPQGLALTASGDICPVTRTVHPAPPAHRAPLHPGPGRALRPAHRRPRPLSRHRPHPPLRGQIPPKPCIKDISYVGSPEPRNMSLAACISHWPWQRLRVHPDHLVAVERLGVDMADERIVDDLQRAAACWVSLGRTCRLVRWRILATRSWRLRSLAQPTSPKPLWRLLSAGKPSRCAGRPGRTGRCLLQGGLPGTRQVRLA